MGHPRGTHDRATRLDAVKHWEGGRRQPEVAARAYLTVIAKEPEAVMRALGREEKPRKRAESKAA
jgi:putative transcriptional regulator